MGGGGGKSRQPFTFFIISAGMMTLACRRLMPKVCSSPGVGVEMACDGPALRRDPGVLVE